MNVFAYLFKYNCADFQKLELTLTEFSLPDQQSNGNCSDYLTVYHGTVANHNHKQVWFLSLCNQHGSFKGIPYTEFLENDYFVILHYMNLQHITDLSMALSFSSGSH